MSEAPTTIDETVDRAQDLYVFVADHPLLAQEMILAAMRMQARHHLDLEDAAIAHKDDQGRVRIVQTKDINPSQGAVSGAWWGALAGLLVAGQFLVGAALGAAAGGLFAKLRDLGIDDDGMKDMAERLAPGESAVFFLVKDCHQARALHELSRFTVTLLHTTADDDLAEQIRERLAVDPWGGPA